MRKPIVILKNDDYSRLFKNPEVLRRLLKMKGQFNNLDFTNAFSGILMLSLMHGIEVKYFVGSGDWGIDHSVCPVDYIHSKKEYHISNSIYTNNIPKN